MQKNALFDGIINDAKSSEKEIAVDKLDISHKVHAQNTIEKRYLNS